MRMLEDLHSKLGEIAKVDEWANKFITDIMFKKAMPDSKQLTGAQFRKIQELHNRYCGPTVHGLPRRA